MKVFKSLFLSISVISSLSSLSTKASTLLETNDNWSDSQIKELLNFQPKWRLGKDEYRKVTRLYVFCRKNRNYTCLMLMKDKDGNFVRNEDGEIWNQRKLALSGYDRTYDQSNGHTPQGVFTIDSVMPDTNRQMIYGKFRRMKLDFIKKSNNEKDLRHYIPEDLQDMNWWQETVIARDNGRSLFRIHGVGYQNIFSNARYYPFIPTAGCIASLEGEYDGVVYKDQQVLLDTFMESMGLEPKFENEVKIKGMLYVVNINDEERPVELEDIL